MYEPCINCNFEVITTEAKNGEKKTNSSIYTVADIIVLFFSVANRNKADKKYISPEGMRLFYCLSLTQNKTREIT